MRRLLLVIHKARHNITPKVANCFLPSTRQPIVCWNLHECVVQLTHPLAFQGPTSTVRATFRGVSSLLRHASAGTLSSVSGVTNALSRNLGHRGGVVRPIAGTMGLVRGGVCALGSIRE